MLKREFWSSQFLLFLFSGGLAAVVNFGSRIVFDYFLPIRYGTAIVLAYFMGMVVAFSLYRKHVFDRSHLHPVREAAHFTIINGLAVLQTLVVSLVLANHLLPALHIQWFRKEIAHAAGIAVPIFTSFLGHKYFTFRRQPSSSTPPTDS